MRDGSTKFPTNEAHPWRRVALIDSSGFRFADLPCHANQNSSDIRLDNVNSHNQARVYVHDKCDCFKCATHSEFASAGYGKKRRTSSQHAPMCYTHTPLSPSRHALVASDNSSHDVDPSNRSVIIDTGAKSFDRDSKWL